MPQDPKNTQYPTGGVSSLKSMEEARRDVLLSQRKHLEKIWDEAVNKEGGNAYKIYFIGNPAQKLLDEIETVLGRPVNAKKQLIQLGYIRHINSRHGIGGVAVDGQVPITRETFALIPDVLKSFDSVEKGHDTRGGDGILIRKRYSDGTAVLVNVVPINGNLEIRSFRVDKNK